MRLPRRPRRVTLPLPPQPALPMELVLMQVEQCPHARGGEPVGEQGTPNRWRSSPMGDGLHVGRAHLGGTNTLAPFLCMWSEYHETYPALRSWPVCSLTMSPRTWG